MSISLRLDPEIKSKIKTASFFSKGVKNFSDTFRTIIGLGLSSFEQNYLENSINQEAQSDIRFIAQKHDLGVQLSRQEIFYIISGVNAFIKSKHLPYQETEKGIIELFSYVIQSRCFVLSEECLKVFAHNELISSYEDTKNIYKTIEENGLKLIQKLQQPKDFIDIKDTRYCLERIGNILQNLCSPTEAYIADIHGFNKALQSHLLHYIRARKWLNVYRDKTKSVLHLECADLFYKENDIHKLTKFHSNNYEIFLNISDCLNFSATIYLKMKGILLHLNFYELDEILKAVTFLNFSSVNLKNISRNLSGSRFKISLTTDENATEFYSLFFKEISFFLSKEEWEELSNLMSTIKTEWTSQLNAIQHQLGSY